MSCKFFIFITLLLAFTQPSEAQSWLDELALDLRKEAATKGVPGFIFVVVEAGKPNRYYTHGHTEAKGDRIRKNTVFRLASVSKTFTAALIAKQQQNPVLNWQTPVNLIVPQYPFDKDKNTPILLSHIVGQSTGFMPNAYDNLIEANYDRRRVLSMLSELKPLCKPGDCYTYQNAFFGVLEEYYIQQKSSFSEQLKQDIIDPLQMSASTGRQALLASENWAKPHAAIAKNKWAKVRVKEDYYRYTPAAGINASAEDLAIWMRAMLLEYPEVISQNTVEELTTPIVETKREVRRRGWRGKLKSAHYGLGWRIYNFNDVKINYHGGWVQGYRADVSFAPELKTGFAFLMNAESNLINTATPTFWTQKIEQMHAQQKLAEADKP